MCRSMELCIHHHHRKKSKCIKLRHYFTSFFLTAWSILLHSSVRVASLALQPRLVELWKCRAQHLRQFYSVQKHKQNGAPTISCDVWYFPMILTVWLIVMNFVVLSALKNGVTYEMDEDIAESHFHEVMFLCFPMVLLWWRCAVDESHEQSKSRHYNSIHCYSNCAMCSHHLLRNGTVQTSIWSSNIPVTMIVLPLKHKCSQKRVVKYIIPKRNGPPRVIHQLLMLAGDIELNPGPETKSGIRLKMDDRIEQSDYDKIRGYLKELRKEDIVKVGLSLGLDYVMLSDLPTTSAILDMIHKWRLYTSDSTLRALVKALKENSCSGIAEKIERENGGVSSEEHCVSQPVTGSATPQLIQHSSQDAGSQISPHNLRTKENYTSSGENGRVSSEEHSGSQTFVDYRLNTQESIASSGSVSPSDIHGEGHESFKPWTVRPGSPQKHFLAQLHVETEEIKIHFVKVLNEFKSSFLQREEQDEVSFEDLSDTAQQLFDFKDEYIESFQSNSKKLLSKIFRRQSYVNFDLLLSVIKACGTLQDRKEAEQYKQAFKQYAKRRTFESNSEILGSIPEHETVMFILDKGQLPFRLIDAYTFKAKLCKLLDIQRYDIVLHEIKQGCIIIVFQIQPKCINRFRSIPLFYDKIYSLKKKGTQSYKLGDEEVNLNCWNILEFRTVMHYVSKRIKQVSVGGRVYLSLWYSKTFTDEQKADIGYVKYLNIFVSGKYKHLPTVRGVYYHPPRQSQNKTTYYYPTIVIEKLKPLKDVLLKQEISPVNQISLLLNISLTAFSFESDRSLHITIHPDSVLLEEGSDKHLKFFARFCPLYNYSFHNITAVSQGFHLLEPLPLRDLQWMEDIVKFIHFQGKILDKMLPESHILKKMFDQKWISKEDRFRPTSFKSLCEDLQHLLETEKTWMGLVASMYGDDELVDDEVQIHLILIGDTGVGKTSLRKHLKDEPIDMSEPPTIVMEPEVLYRESLDISSANVPFQSIMNAVKSSSRKVFLTMWDTGGQPIFQDLLPCFARLKCMYGIVFRLPDLLKFDDTPDIRPCNEHSKIVKSPFTNKDIVHRNLAYVQAFSCTLRENLPDAPRNDGPNVSYPATVIVGTCKDVVVQYSNQRLIDMKKDELKEYIRTFVDSHPVSLFSADTSFIHEIDNTLSGNVHKDCGIRQLRGTITQCAQNSRAKMHKSWKMFEVKLQRLCYTSRINLGIISITDAIAIGKECHVSNPSAALMYFHELGTFMWYHLSARENMKRFVVIDPKALLEVLAKLFCYNPHSLSLDSKQLIEKGIVTIDYFRTLLKQKASDIDDSWFMDFLEEHHLNIKVILPGRNCVCFFLPSLLATEPDYLHNLVATSKASPLYVVPESGYVATGMFTRLLTALAGVTYGSTVWRIPLHDGQLKKVCRNQFEFIVNDCVHIILSEFSKYIRIDCLQFKDSVISKDLYFQIAFTLDVQLQRIVPRWIDNKGFDITLKCENEACSSLNTHFLHLEKSLLELNTMTSKCSEKQECSLQPSQMIWFGKSTIPPTDKSDLFEKSLQQGILDLSIVSVLFTGLNNSSCANAKNVVFQEPIISELQLTRRFCHELYFRPHGHPDLTKLQPENYKEAILYSVGQKATEVMPSVSKPKVLLKPSRDDQLLLPTPTDNLYQSKVASSEAIPMQFPQLPSEIIPNMQRPQLKESPAAVAKETNMVAHTKSEFPPKKMLETDEMSLLNSTFSKGFPIEYEPQPKKHREMTVTSLLSDAASNEFLINSMAHYKNHGNIELVHVFRCQSYDSIKEIFKIFVKNVSLSALVTGTSKRLDPKELNILEENSKFAQKGIVIGSSAIWQSNRMAKNKSLSKFSKFLLASQPNDYIFSMNYEQPQDQDWKTGAEILDLAFNLAPSKNYPFSWYLFGFKLYHFMISNNVHAIRVSKHCMVIAKALNMNKETVIAALEHLTESNIILYFGDILNDTVFANADVFLRIFSELSDIFYSSNAATQPPTMISASKLYDIIEPCVEECMLTSDFTMLFRKLLIMAPYDSEHFIIPSFLPLLNDRERKKACTDGSSIEPLYLECPSIGYELFSMLQVFLLTLPTEKWKLLKDSSGNAVCLHKNCTKFFNTEINCIVTLSISGQYIEIYLNTFHDTQKNFSCVSTTILHGLEAIKLILNQHQSYDFGISFKCLCRQGSHQFHTASFDQKLDRLICKNSGQLPITDLQRRWIKSDGYVQRYLTVNEIVSHLKSMAGKWIEVAASLNVPTAIVDSILVSRLQNDEASLRRVIEWWFKNTPNPEWSAIQRVLKRQTATSESVVLSPATHAPWMTGAYSRDMFGLHHEICDFYDYIKPQPQDFELRREIIARTVGIIKKRWPKAKVRYFGSFCTGLFLPSGDIDLVIFLKGISLDHLVDNLKSIALENSVLLLNQSSYPIIKFTDRLTRIKVDITINQNSGIKNTKVIEEFIRMYPYLPKLVFVLKQFLYQRNLHDVFYGGISSFILILLLVSFLQQYPHRWFITNPNPNLGKLLISFFEFYGTKFSFENTGISVLKGGKYFSKKDHLVSLEKGDHSQLYIVDPSYPNKNAARTCFGVPEIRQVFAQASFRLHERVVIMRNITKRMESNLNVILKESDVKQKSGNTTPLSPVQPSAASNQDTDAHHFPKEGDTFHYHHPVQEAISLPKKSFTS